MKLTTGSRNAIHVTEEFVVTGHENTNIKVTIDKGNYYLHSINSCFYIV